MEATTSGRILWQFGTREIVYAAIGSALYAILSWATYFLQLPASGNISIRPAVAVPMFFGIVFGPIVGFTTGFIGSILADLLTGYPLWFWWAMGNGIQGFVPGLIWLTISDYRAVSTIIRTEIMVILGVVLGMGILSFFQLGISRTNFATTLEVSFLPAFITNAFWGLLLTPILMRAYASIQARSLH